MFDRIIFPSTILVIGALGTTYTVANGLTMIAIIVAIVTVILFVSGLRGDNGLPDAGTVGIIGLVATIVSLMAASPTSAAISIGTATAVLAFLLACAGSERRYVITW